MLKMPNIPSNIPSNTPSNTPWEIIIKIIIWILTIILGGLSESEAIKQAASKFNMSESAVWEIWKNRK